MTDQDFTRGYQAGVRRAQQLLGSMEREFRTATGNPNLLREAARRLDEVASLAPLERRRWHD